jgi:hypothetical protein
MKPRHLLAFLSLPRGDRRLLLQALIGLPATALALRLFGFNRWYTGLRRLVRPRRKLAVPNMMRAYRIARLVRLANGRLRPSANCLQRSLVLWTLLRRHGVESDLRIGVRKADGRTASQADTSTPANGAFEAHAWVEWQGVVLNDAPDVRRRYAPFERPILPRGVWVE